MNEADEELTGLVRFLQRINRLKFEPRAGWLDRGVPPDRTESVADHSFRVALMAWLASAGVPGLDRDRAIRLALLHDLAEAVTGDLPPYDPVVLDNLEPDARREALNRRHIAPSSRKAAKQRAENDAIADLIDDLAPDVREEVAALWRELQERATPEARFVKQLDGLETYLQSREYLARYPDLPMASFAAEVDEVITIPELAAVRDAIASLPGDGDS